jgi:hypothetical protein
MNKYFTLHLTLLIVCLSMTFCSTTLVTAQTPNPLSNFTQTTHLFTYTVSTISIPDGDIPSVPCAPMQSGDKSREEQIVTVTYMGTEPISDVTLDIYTVSGNLYYRYNLGDMQQSQSVSEPTYYSCFRSDGRGFGSGFLITRENVIMAYGDFLFTYSISSISIPDGETPLVPCSEMKSGDTLRQEQIITVTYVGTAPITGATFDIYDGTVLYYSYNLTFTSGQSVSVPTYYSCLRANGESYSVGFNVEISDVLMAYPFIASEYPFGVLLALISAFALFALLAKVRKRKVT